jgi:hypothetical protein
MATVQYDVLKCLQKAANVESLAIQEGPSVKEMADLLHLDTDQIRGAIGGSGQKDMTSETIPGAAAILYYLAIRDLRIPTQRGC